MTKTLRKAITHRSKLKISITKGELIIIGQIIKNKDIFGWTCCVKPKHYFLNLNIRDLSNNRIFWKTIKPYFTNKGLNSNELLHKEKENLAPNEKQLAIIMNSFFINITKGLELTEDNESMRILWKVFWMLSILILVLKELGELLKLMKNSHFNQYQKIWYEKSKRL